MTEFLFAGKVATLTTHRVHLDDVHPVEEVEGGYRPLGGDSSDNVVLPMNGRLLGSRLGCPLIIKLEVPGLEDE